MNKFSWERGDIELAPPCDNCKRRIGETVCQAFPNGIPKKILEGKEQHRKPISGDRGLVWEQSGSDSPERKA